MKGAPAIYLGRIVEKHNFRAFIYGAEGQRRLVESWEEFEANMQSGVWFATREEAEASKAVVEDKIVQENKKSKARPKPKSKAKPAPVEEVQDDAEDVLDDDDSVFEVTDDFLPDEKA